MRGDVDVHMIGVIVVCGRDRQFIPLDPPRYTYIIDGFVVDVG